MKKTKRRLVFTAVAILATVLMFGVRLVDIQLVRADELNATSLSKRSIPVTTYGERGSIVDANGVVLAGSVDRFDINADPSSAKEFTRLVDGEKVKISVVDAVSELAEATGVDATTLMTALLAKPDANFAYLVKSVDLDARTKVKALRIPWIYTSLHPSRTYPNGAVGGNLVGFIGTDGPQAGVELSKNDCLASANGESTYERSEDGIRLPGSTVTLTEPKNGGTIKLTIDSDFQWYVQQAIAARAQEIGADWATAIVVRVKDAHIMAVADYPSVDPNDVNGVASDSLGSKAFSVPYEPGSTFKPMTAAMLLDAGLITQNTQVDVPGRLTVGGGYIKDAWAHSNIHFTTTGVLVNSSNIGISLLSDKMSKDDRFAYLKKFGIGDKTGAFPGESAGVLNPTSKWDPITNYAVSFGQGVSATSAQVASIYQTLGNGGVRLPLTLIEGCTNADGTVTDLPATEGTRVVSDTAANQTVGMLANVVSQGALRNVLSIPGYNIAAKTGTAQVAEGGRYTSDRVVSVAALLPAEAPEYAVVVTFGKPDTMKTSAAAAPTMNKIMTQIIKTFRVTPSTTPSPVLPVNW